VEDTHSARLMQHFGIGTPLVCHEHNERDQGGCVFSPGRWPVTMWRVDPGWNAAGFDPLSTRRQARAAGVADGTPVLAL
jgi:16S rRNA (cytidine1402-2'-O)-methyltransferase